MTLEVRGIIDRYLDRGRDPALRPPGALPVECSFFTFPLTEIAQLDEQSQDIS